MPRVAQESRVRVQAVAAQAASADHRLAARKAMGMATASCGLQAKKPRQAPARAGRVSSSSVAAAKQVALYSPFWPMTRFRIAAGKASSGRIGQPCGVRRRRQAAHAAKPADWKASRATT